MVPPAGETENEISGDRRRAQADVEAGDRREERAASKKKRSNDEEEHHQAYLRKKRRQEARREEDRREEERPLWYRDGRPTHSSTNINVEEMVGCNKVVFEDEVQP